MERAVGLMERKGRRWDKRWAGRIDGDKGIMGNDQSEGRLVVRDKRRAEGVMEG